MKDATAHKKARYPCMEYLFLGEEGVVYWPLLGSIIRSIGKGWKVAVIAPSEREAYWSGQVSKWEQDLLLVNPHSFAGVKMCILDPYLSPDEALMWRSKSEILGKMHLLAAGETELGPEFNLVSHVELTHKQVRGVCAFTGNGKGKTTSALGWAWEQAQEKPIMVVQWFKEKATGRLTWAIHEHHAPQRMAVKDGLVFHATGLGFFGSPALDRVAGEEAYQKHRLQAMKGVALASQALREGKVGAIVLDEFVDTLQAVSHNMPQDLLRKEEVRALLSDAARSSIPVAVTGRRVTPEWEEFVATHIEIENLRHPWTHERRAAVSGLDY